MVSEVKWTTAILEICSLERSLRWLVPHATHPISTGKLEVMNNKIKVAKKWFTATEMRTISFI